MKNPKKVWVEADWRYVASTVIAAACWIVPLCLLGIVCLAAIWFGSQWAISPMEGYRRVVLALLVAIAGTVSFLSFDYALYLAKQYLGCFYMNEADRDQLYAIHKVWVAECKAAQKEGRPQPTRPY